MFPSAKPYPNHAISELKKLLDSKVGEGNFVMKLSQDGNINVVVQDGLLSFYFLPYQDITTRILPDDKLYSLWNVSVVRNNADENCGRNLDSKINSASLKMVLDWVGKHLDNIDEPDYVQHAYNKAEEPYARGEGADAPIQNDSAIDRAVEALKHQIMLNRNNGSMPEPAGDEMTDWDANGEYNNIVKGSFPKDKERVEAKKTPDMSYNKKQGKLPKNPYKDGYIRLNEAQANELLAMLDEVDEADAKKQMVNEGLKWNYDDELGAIVSPKSVPDNRPRVNTIVPHNPNSDDMKTLFRRRAGITGEQV